MHSRADGLTREATEAAVPSAQADLTAELRGRAQKLEQYGWWEWGLGAAVAAAVIGMLYCLATDTQIRLDFRSSGAVFFVAVLLLLLVAWLARDRAWHAHIAEFEAVIETVQRHLLSEKSIRDRLTSAFNREGLEEIAPTFLRQAERAGRSLVLLLIDMDYFHDLNNKFGHIAGDNALIEFARIIDSSVRGSDLVTRYGGDEFVILLPDTGLVGSQAVVRRIEEKLNRRNQASDQFSLAFSSGAAEFRKGQQLKDLFGEADKDLLRRKQERPETEQSARRR